MTLVVSLYYQCAISDNSTIVGGAPGGPLSTWVFDGTAQTIVPPVGFQKENPSTSGSPCERTRPRRKTGDISPDRTETRLEPRDPEGRRPGALRSGRSWRLTPFSRMETLSRRLATKLQLRDKVASRQQDYALYRGSASFNTCCCTSVSTG